MNSQTLYNIRKNSASGGVRTHVSSNPCYSVTTLHHGDTLSVTLPYVNIMEDFQKFNTYN